MNPNVRSKVANQSVRVSAHRPQFLYGSPGNLNPHLRQSFHWLWNNSIWISWIQIKIRKCFQRLQCTNLSLNEFRWKTKCKTIFHLINSLLKSEHDGCEGNKATGMCVCLCVFVRAKRCKDQFFAQRCASARSERFKWLQSLFSCLLWQPR